MKVQEIMTNQIAFVTADDTIEKAAQLMKQHNVGSIPVCESDRIIGIITDRDIAVRDVAQGANVRQTVSSIMTPNPVVGSPDMEVQEAARMMSENQIRRLPIVDRGRLVGIVSLGDISTEQSFKQSAGEALNDISQPSNGPM